MTCLIHSTTAAFAWFYQSTDGLLSFLLWRAATQKMYVTHLVCFHVLTPPPRAGWLMEPAGFGLALSLGTWCFPSYISWAFLRKQSSLLHFKCHDGQNIIIQVQILPLREKRKSISIYSSFHSNYLHLITLFDFFLTSFHLLLMFVSIHI